MKIFVTLFFNIKKHIFLENRPSKRTSYKKREREVLEYGRKQGKRENRVRKNEVFLTNRIISVKI